MSSHHHLLLMKLHSSLVFKFRMIVLQVYYVFREADCLLVSLEMPGLDKKEEEIPHPVLVMASTGPSAEKWPQLMGEYRLTEERSGGRVVYKHCTDEWYIYSDPRTRRWLVKNTVGGGLAALVNISTSSDCPPKTGWGLVGDDWRWAADLALSIQPPPASQAEMPGLDDPGLKKEKR